MAHSVLQQFESANQ